MEVTGLLRNKEDSFLTVLGIPGSYKPGGLKGLLSENCLALIRRVSSHMTQSPGKSLGGSLEMLHSRDPMSCSMTTETNQRGFVVVVLKMRAVITTPTTHVPCQ